jgi:hypothetical protein
MARKGSKGGQKTNSKEPPSPSNRISFPSNLLLDDNDNKKDYRKPLRLETLLRGSIWVLYDLFSAKECQAWVNFMEKDSRMETVQQRGTRYLAHRECHRYSMDDPVMANRLFDRLSAELLSSLPIFPSQEPVACNPNLRLYKYTKGMSFGRHIDESCTLPGLGETRFTILIYLSSCQGGATRFEHDVAFVPQAGAMLIHLHGDDCLLHEAEPVESGIKYILRTDLVYARSK